MHDEDHLPRAAPARLARAASLAAAVVLQKVVVSRHESEITVLRKSVKSSRLKEEVKILKMFV